ncbi:subtilisin-like protein, partial [Colletotrichum somersetense]
DNTGHGTHVAGIAAGWFYGIAPKANIISVKVRGATTENVTQGSLLVCDLHTHSLGPSGWKGSVINMSVGVPASTVLRQAVESAYSKGIPMAAAAGNDNVEAYQTPRIYEEVMCTGATDRIYHKATFSNCGGAVDLIAPGHRVMS